MEGSGPAFADHGRKTQNIVPVLISKSIGFFYLLKAILILSIPIAYYFISQNLVKKIFSISWFTCLNRFTCENVPRRWLLEISYEKSLHTVSDHCFELSSNLYSSIQSFYYFFFPFPFSILKIRFMFILFAKKAKNEFIFCKNLFFA